MRQLNDPLMPHMRYAVWYRCDSSKNIAQVKSWLRTSCRGTTMLDPTEVVFELLEDAVLFEITWLS